MRLETIKTLYLTPDERATLKEAKEIFGQAIDLYESEPVGEHNIDVHLLFEVYDNILKFLDYCE